MKSICTLSDILAKGPRLSAIKPLFVQWLWSDVVHTYLSPYESTCCHIRCWKWSPPVSMHDWTWWSRVFGNQVITKALSTDKVLRLNPTRSFPAGPTEGKVLHEQASYHDTLKENARRLLPFLRTCYNVYSNPSVYQQLVYEFLLIRDGKLLPVFQISSQFLFIRAPSSHKPIVVPGASSRKLIFVLRVFALRVVLEERIKLVNRGITVFCSCEYCIQMPGAITVSTLCAGCSFTRTEVCT
jgi:hypothetical protein